ncbi:unnamed protein product [Rhizophagus irregularis]|nr:unnamed protein product [Rhizophagus irregularis]
MYLSDVFCDLFSAARTLDSPSNAQYTLDKPPSPTSFMSEFYQMVSSLENAYRNFDARHTSKGFIAKWAIFDYIGISI